MALLPCCMSNGNTIGRKKPEIFKASAPTATTAVATYGSKWKASLGFFAKNEDPFKMGLHIRRRRRKREHFLSFSSPSSLFSRPTASLDTNGEFELSPSHSTNKLDQSSPLATFLSGDKSKGSLRLIGVVAALVVVALLVASVATLVSGGQTTLVEASAKSGFPAAFALIFISEIGDKTFFIAALLAMQHSRSLVMLGSCGALALMTMISVAIGRIFHAIPTQLKTTIPIGQYAAVALLFLFGFKSIKHAWDLPSASTQVLEEEITEMGELAEAEEFVKKAEVKKISTPIELLGKIFSLIFLAEWGDRSMLATIALGAAQSPLGVTVGAVAGHVIATGIAVVGGSFLARYISEKMVSYMGGCLFLAFAAATLMGAF